MKTDSQLQRDVMTELEWEPRIDAAHIGVAAKNGVITLSGSVPSYWEKYEAVEAAKRVNGVKAVVDEIEVKLPGSSERTDTDIAEAAVRAPRATSLYPTTRSRLPFARAGSRSRARSTGSTRRLPPRALCGTSSG